MPSIFVVHWLSLGVDFFLSWIDFSCFFLSWHMIGGLEKSIGGMCFVSNFVCCSGKVLLVSVANGRSWFSICVFQSSSRTPSHAGTPLKFKQLPPEKWWLEDDPASYWVSVTFQGRTVHVCFRDYPGPAATFSFQMAYITMAFSKLGVGWSQLLTSHPGWSYFGGGGTFFDSMDDDAQMHHPQTTSHETPMGCFMGMFSPWNSDVSSLWLGGGFLWIFGGIQ